MFRRYAVLLLALALAACGSSDDTDTSEVEAAASPTPTDTVIAVPVTAEKQPSDFSGDDSVFIKRVHGYLDRRKKKTDLSDAEMVKLGREFCSVTSGGGMLADKVDFWAGARGLSDESADVEIFYAAWDAYCPEFRDGYTKVRLSAKTARPTSAETADLIRFVTTFRHPDADARLAAVSDSEVAQAGGRFCAMRLEAEWPSSRIVGRLIGAIPEEVREYYLLALTLGYCPDRSDAVAKALGMRMPRQT